MPSEVIESLIRSKKLNIFCIQYSIWFYTSKDIKLTLTWYFAMTTPTNVIPIKHMIVTLEKKISNKVLQSQKKTSQIISLESLRQH